MNVQTSKNYLWGSHNHRNFTKKLGSYLLSREMEGEVCFTGIRDYICIHIVPTGCPSRNNLARKCKLRKEPL